MKDIFITNIKINNVRHLSDINISLSNDERKHLIFTGKNGSGKTSVLKEVYNYLSLGVVQQQLLRLNNWSTSIKNSLNRINVLKAQSFTNSTKQEIQNNRNLISDYKKKLEKFQGINLSIKENVDIIDFYHKGEYLLTYFNAKRTNQIPIPQGIKKFQVQKTYKLSDRANQYFLQHIVNLKAERSFARDDSDNQTVKAIDKWFNNFEEWLKTIFDDKNLRLQFDRKNYNFDIVLSDNVVVNFNTLSDGYSALLNIVMELMMRMENSSNKVYDIQGIVLIDEIETHLHIDLQKKVLPFLTTVFPNIQFIVTTHSPFVLNSIDNAIIYDLEKRIQVEDLSAYSIDGIIEGYFENDQYSQNIKNKINRFEALVNKENQNEYEWEEMMNLRNYLKSIPSNLAPELVAKFQQIELKRLTTNNILA